MTDNRMNTWSEKWVAGKIGWHLAEVNSWLIKYKNILELSATPKRVFVPLCGKTIDLKWFYDGGHIVVGLEAIEKGVLEFYEENNIPYLIDTLPFGKLYKSQDDRLQIYVCDIFAKEIDSNTLGKFDVIWDRGSLVAIFIEDRERYAMMIKELLSPTSYYLLSTVQYDGLETATGPPRCIPTTLVDKLFGDFCNQRVLETVDVTDDKVRNIWKLEQCFETCSLLTPKKS